MTQKYIAKLMPILRSLFPRDWPTSDDDVLVLIDAYTTGLKNVPDTEFDAVKSFVTQSCKYRPTPAHILERVQDDDDEGIPADSVVGKLFPHLVRPGRRQAS